MVFASLGTNERDAFFTLLDEYFASRPEIFSPMKDGGSSAPVASSNPFRREGVQAQATAAVVGHVGDAAAKFVMTGARNAAVNARTTYDGAQAASTIAGQQSEASESMDTRSGGSLKDRMAALQAGRSSVGSAHSTDRGSASNLTSVKKFGDVDMSSGKNFFSSVRNSSSNPPKSSNAMDNVPSAFPPKNSGSRFGAPPTRAAAPPAPPPSEPEPEEGEWAEVLYDFESSEAGDLPIQEGQQVLVIEKTSDDWWTGEIDGKKGLFPASYVKLL